MQPASVNATAGEHLITSTSPQPSITAVVHEVEQAVQSPAPTYDGPLVHPPPPSGAYIALRIVLLIFFHVFFFLLLASYYRVVMTDAGSVPRSFEPSVRHDDLDVEVLTGHREQQNASQMEKGLDSVSSVRTINQVRGHEKEMISDLARCRSNSPLFFLSEMREEDGCE